ncbi:NAD(P)/FAD-dependent oxidoreductase [Mesorhizobium ciceri]|uniref:NAD(P)/FAD-dependent oxidoreductase n=1 Tax=Mesorhizobium TaxID=68287 RepID=UPI0004B3F125|nr:FAD-binding oxidoreductase [Mesorhizobium ciceri]
MTELSNRTIIVVGAGVVGLCVAYEAIKRGASVTIVDRDPEGDKASCGNAGCIAVSEVLPASVPGLWKKVPRWILDPLGPLSLRMTHLPRLLPWLWNFAQAGSPAEVERISEALAALNHRVYADLVPLFADIGLSGDLHRNGALTVYETEKGWHAATPEWEAKQRLGIDVRHLSADQARELEPALGPLVKSAVLTPRWSHVSDPKRVVDSLRSWLTANGARVLAAQVSRIAPSPKGGTVTLADSSVLNACKIVVAAGAWSAELSRQVGDIALLESERGYNTTIAAPQIALNRTMIFAERNFVAAPLSIGLRIGGAAEFGGLLATPNFARSKGLVELAKAYLPGLDGDGGIVWSGHRPATPDTLPVISRSATHAHILYAFGHGHLGLTQGPTTGKLIGDLLCGRDPPIPLEPYAIERFSAAGRTTSRKAYGFPSIGI